MPLNELEENRPAKGVPRRRWLIAFLLAFGVLVNYFDRVNLSVAKQGLEKDFGIGNIGFGYLLSAYNWTYAALQLPTGVLLDRFGVQAIGRTSAILWSLACFGGAFSPGVKTFFGSRLLLGIGEAPTFPANAKATGMWLVDWRFGRVPACRLVRSLFIGPSRQCGEGGWHHEFRQPGCGHSRTGCDGLSDRFAQRLLARIYCGSGRDSGRDRRICFPSRQDRTNPRPGSGWNYALVPLAGAALAGLFVRAAHS